MRGTLWKRCDRWRDGRADRFVLWERSWSQLKRTLRAKIRFIFSRTNCKRVTLAKRLLGETRRVFITLSLRNVCEWYGAKSYRVWDWNTCRGYENIDVILCRWLGNFSDSPNGLQNGITALHGYCTKWKLKLNTEKSKVMVFKKGRPNVSTEWYLGPHKL